MKKILSLGLTLALFAGGMTLGSAPFVSATSRNGGHHSTHGPL